MKKKLAPIEKKIQTIREEFKKITSDYENKVPNTEINLSYDLSNAPENIQYFASDVGRLLSRGTLNDFLEHFIMIEKSMKENNLSEKNVIFDFQGSEFLGEPAILIKVFGDESVNRNIYLKEVYKMSDLLNGFKKDINLTIDSFDEIHKEYAKEQPEVNMDKAHEKLLSPYKAVIADIDSLLQEQTEKITQYSPAKNTKLKR